MRPLLKAHVALVALLAATLVAADLLAVVAWPRAWSPGIALALLMLAAMADQLQFEVKRGWYTTAGAVPHLAAAFLLPPGVAAVVGAIGPVSRAVTHHRPARKVVFNTATTALALAATAHVVNVFGGADLVRPGGGWSDPLVAILASVVYYVTSGTLVALAVALDQGRPVWDVFRGKLGFKAASEIGLGLVGALLALMLAASPNWAPVLLVPAVLLWLAKRSMDSADRRSRHLAVTSTVGRAVAGTLDAEHALRAITVPPVREGLKLDGLALLPLADPAPFGDHVATAQDTEWQMLREALVRDLRRRPRDIVLLANRDRPGWLPTELSERPLAVAAFPFGAGSGRSVGALVAWREVKPRLVEPMDQEELLVLKTLADHAAVALETARLAHETARLHHEAGQAEARLEMEALREVARLKDEFLGQVSHELRTPLTIIHGYAELIADGHVPDESIVRSTAREIHTSSTLMMRLVDDLLDTSRLDAGRIELKTERVELVPWLARTTVAFGQATPSHSVTADLPDPQDLPPVRADLDRLGQVMNNLLSNAVRYSAQGTEIRVTAHVLDECRVEILVTDRGTGIAPEDCQRIFEKFYRGKHGSTLAVRGAGLGLAVARSLVEAHGGQIGVRSTLGQGSTFWVRLPTDVISLPSESPVWIDPASLAA